MKASHLQRLLLAALSVLMLLSCDGGSSIIGLIASGGVGGTGAVSFGSITALGSIVVKGTKFDTSNAAIIVEGENLGVGDAVVLDNLAIGMVVTVEGTINEEDETAIANRVIYNNNVEGPVEIITAVTPTRNDIVVMGQTVIINTVTTFKGTTFDSIAQSDVVEVSGLMDDIGTIWATFIQKTDSVLFEVTGLVKNLDPAQESFEINNLTIDYSMADMSGLSGGMTEGLLIEAEGTLDSTGEIMFAERIEVGDELELDDVDKIEVTGFVTAFSTAFDFAIGTQVVQTHFGTEYIDGTAEDVALGVKLEAEGSLEGGILFADEVEFWEPDQIEVKGLVTEVVSPFEFTVGDQAVQTDDETIFEPEDLMIVEGILLEIKGAPIDIDRSVLIADKVSLEED